MPVSGSYLVGIAASYSMLILTSSAMPPVSKSQDTFCTVYILPSMTTVSLGLGCEDMPHDLTKPASVKKSVGMAAGADSLMAVSYSTRFRHLPAQSSHRMTHAPSSRQTRTGTTGRPPKQTEHSGPALPRGGDQTVVVGTCSSSLSLPMFGKDPLARIAQLQQIGHVFRRYLDRAVQHPHHARLDHQHRELFRLVGVEAGDDLLDRGVAAMRAAGREHHEVERVGLAVREDFAQA